MKKLQHPIVNGIPLLEPVRGSFRCQFSIVENKLETLYENQEKIYALLQIILRNQKVGA